MPFKIKSNNKQTNKRNKTNKQKKSPKVTFAVVDVDMHGLAFSKGTESDHVFMWVESYISERGGVAKLRIHSHLVPWSTTRAQWEHSSKPTVSRTREKAAQYDIMRPHSIT